MDTFTPLNKLIRTGQFVAWLDALRDQKGRARILHRLDQAVRGHFGDCESVGDGVSEMRVHYGPGYRVYYVRRGRQIYLLLGGGTKGTQRRDIVSARKMAVDLKQQGSEAIRS